VPEPTDDEILSTWWAQLEPDLPTATKGLWFGMAELVFARTSAEAEQTTPQVHLYVAGTETFDADDESADWAVPDHLWSPENRYVLVPGLAAPAASFDEVLDRAEALLIELAPQTGHDHLDGVATGFDDGDVRVVWTND